MTMRRNELPNFTFKMNSVGLSEESPHSSVYGQIKNTCVWCTVFYAHLKQNKIYVPNTLYIAVD